MTTVQSALELAEDKNIPVFPCKPNKIPYTDNGFKDASKNIDQIESWFTLYDDALIGVPTGRASNIVVYDVDPNGLCWLAENSQRLAPGRIHKTRRGEHLLYRMPEQEIRNSAGKIAPGVDVRAEGGYVIWWPAHGYNVVGSLDDLTEPPQWLVEASTAKAVSANTCSGQAGGRTIIEGGRSNFLSREAFRMKKQGSTVAQIVVVLAALNQARCVPPLTDEEVRKIAAGKERILPAGVTLEDFHAYMPSHNYMFMPTRELWPPASVNALIPAISVSGGKDISASVWLDQNRPVEQSIWAPGEPEVIEGRLVSNGGWIHREGCRCLNLYLPPTAKHGDAENAGRWVEHVRSIYPDNADHIMNWLAQRVQSPQIKINHALVLGGLQGIGKDTLLEPVKYAVGPWNVNEVSPVNMLGRFNSFVKSVILRVSEARDLGDTDRFAFYDHTKVYTAAPPDVIRCDEKHLREHSVMNVCGVIITTNHKTDGIYLPADDRRHYVAWSDKSKEDFQTDYWTGLYAWYNGGGMQDVAAYLATRDLSAFDPKAPPPKTTAFWSIVDAGRPPEDAQLADILDLLGNPAALTLGDLQHPLGDGEFKIWLTDKSSRRQIPHRLEAAGYVAVRNKSAKDGLWVINRKRQLIYARSDLSIHDRYIAAVKRSQFEGGA